jgi:DMSO/TMAO reductase YedYZ molybdopterin-dependent catalytic subunit
MPPPHGLTRREFAALIARSAMGAAAMGALPSCMRAPLSGPLANAGLIELSDRPEHLETSLAALGREWLTPSDRFFVRSHLMVPEIDVATWRLDVGGMVAQPQSYTLSELRTLGQVEHAITIECAGNGRGLMPLANTSGTQWTYGAVGNARWKGIPLPWLLRRAQPSDQARYVWFEAADIAPMPGVPKFIRSLPLGKADDVLLAHTMNRAPLSPAHGAPLRAVTPGWYGMASTKWLTKITLSDRPSDNHFQIRGYRWNKPGEDPLTSAPVEEMRVKSVITRPLEGAALTGPVTAEGFAWSAVPVRSVALSLDGGTTWRDATFHGEIQPGAWRSWKTQLDLPPGRHTLMARATDERGNAQPLESPVNAGGYGNNRIHQVSFDVRA